MLTGPNIALIRSRIPGPINFVVLKKKEREREQDVIYLNEIHNQFWNKFRIFSFVPLPHKRRKGKRQTIDPK